jgi:hypothetical protein
VGEFAVEGAQGAAGDEVAAVVGDLRLGDVGRDEEAGVEGTHPVGNLGFGDGTYVEVLGTAAHGSTVGGRG